MVDNSVPVTMGSPRFTVREVHRFLVTHAWFPPGVRLEPHVHDRPTFAVILRGGFDLHFASPAIRKKHLPSPAGSIFTEPAGEKHANTVSAEGASVIVLQPDPDGADLPPAGLDLFDDIHHFRHGKVATIARELATEVLKRDGLSALAVESLALEMLVESARLEAEYRCPDDISGWMSRAIEFVHSRFREPLRIRDVARAAEVHPAHLASTFRSTHKMPLATYIRKLKVRWAAHALLHSDDSISRIAFRAGFADQAHLTRVFKSETGTTPGRYRRRHRRAGRGPLFTGWDGPGEHHDLDSPDASP